MPSSATAPWACSKEKSGKTSILGGHGAALLIYSGNKFVKPEELEGYLDWAIHVAGYFRAR